LAIVNKGIFFIINPVLRQTVARSDPLGNGRPGRCGMYKPAPAAGLAEASQSILLRKWLRL
jgi:hypothetical protein